MKQWLTIWLTLFYISAGAAEVPSRWQEVTAYADALQARNPQACIGLGLVEAGTTSMHFAGDCDRASEFEIGSITKTFTATLLAMAVVREEVSLQTHLSAFDYLPPGAGAITFEQLATHTSGLPRLPDNFDMSNQDDPYAAYNEASLLAYLESMAEPAGGDVPAYSNLGMGLLGYILARERGVSYAKLVEAEISRPLGMLDTRQSPGPRALTGHTADGTPTSHWQFDVMAGAGALNATVADVLRYLQAHQQPTDTVLGKAMAITHAARADMPGVGAIGLGWMRSPLGRGTVLWHDGGTGGFRAWAGFVEGGDRAVVVLANQVLEEVEVMGQALIGGKARLLEPVARSQPENLALAPLTGRYRLRKDFFLDISQQDGQLYGQATGQSMLPLRFVKENWFRFEGVAAELEFKNIKANADAVILYQNGAEIRGPRIGDVPVVTAVDVSTELLDEYVGQYELFKGFVLTVSRDGNQLLVQATGQQQLPVFAESDQLFFYKVVDAKIEFHREAGKVSGLTLHQGGAKFSPRL